MPSIDAMIDAMWSPDGRAGMMTGCPPIPSITARIYFSLTVCAEIRPKERMHAVTPISGGAADGIPRRPSARRVVAECRRVAEFEELRIQGHARLNVVKRHARRRPLRIGDLPPRQHTHPFSAADL